MGTARRKSALTLFSLIRKRLDLGQVPVPDRRLTHIYFHVMVIAVI